MVPNLAVRGSQEEKTPERALFHMQPHFPSLYTYPMTRPILISIFVIVLIVVIVGVDILFFRDRFWERLVANIGIVLIFLAFFLRFLK
jgi:hypothetical protein